MPARQLRRVLPPDATWHPLTVAGDRLATFTVPGPDAAPGARPLHVVVCHGFTNHVARPSFARIVGLIRRYAAVSALDFRGHGGSGGGTSVGGDGELADLDALLADVRRRDPDAVVVTLGFSMGGSVAIRQAARGRHRPDAVVAISPVSRWYTRDTRKMRQLHWLLESRIGRLAAPYAVRTRLGDPWVDPPEQPIDVVADVAPAPLLIVHGTADRYFGTEHATALQAASGGHADLWIVPGFGHAESGMTPALLQRIMRWVLSRADVVGAREAAA